MFGVLMSSVKSIICVHCSVREKDLESPDMQGGRGLLFDRTRPNTVTWNYFGFFDLVVVPKFGDLNTLCWLSTCGIS